jgi:hypothetical protein
MTKLFLKLLSLAGLALVLPSCSQNGLITSLGYTIGPRYTESIRTVRVPIFKNRTTIRNIEYELTQAVVQRIHQVTPWKVVQSNADAELIGAVVFVQKRDFLQNPLNEVREADLTVTAELVFHDCRTGKNLMRPGEDVLPSVPPVDPLAPAPVAVSRPVLVQWSATFIPEVGESYASARARVVQELAVQIVNMMESPW